jgi:hypothetical protein
MNYQLINNPDGSLACIQKTEGINVFKIPLAEGNRHYAEYLEWVAAGNTPDPAETVDPWEAIRQKRDALIRKSDWTMTPGATVDQAQWTAYRQILRDLPQTYENAEDVVWPTVPSTSGPNTIEE